MNAPRLASSFASASSTSSSSSAAAAQCLRACLLAIPRTPRPRGLTRTLAHSSRRHARVDYDSLADDILDDAPDVERRHKRIGSLPSPSATTEAELFRPVDPELLEQMVQNERRDYEADLHKAQMDFATKSLRFQPVSPSYFSTQPKFLDEYLQIMEVARKCLPLPLVRPGDQPRRQWREWSAFKLGNGEAIRKTRYNQIINALKRMNMVHPALLPDEAKRVIDSWTTGTLTGVSTAAPIEIDEFGRAAAVGRRKSSAAKAWVVEGEGEIMVNGKPLHHAFARPHDRASAIWALKITDRLDKYNVFALANGGGTTGQAEAITLAISRALVAHEPSLKTALRKAGCVHRDPRSVERKKPGHVKARKMPTWVKR